MANRKICFTVLAVLFSLAVSHNGFAAVKGKMDHKTQKAIKNEVKKTVDQMMHAFEMEDNKTIAAIFPNDETMVNFGTNPKETYVGYTALTKSVQKQFDSFDHAKIRVHNQNITLSTGGTVAWVTEIVNTTLKAKGEKMKLDNMRLTAVLEKQNNQWKIVHLHTSLPTAGQQAIY